MDIFTFDPLYNTLDCCLTEVDRNSLSSWLNDNILQFQCEIIEQNSNRIRADFLILHPTAVHLARSNPDVVLTPLNCQEKKWIFCPFNDSAADRGGGTHWNLLVISRELNFSFLVDSINSKSSSSSSVFTAISELNESICRLCAIRSDLRVLPCIQQTNASDCGIFVLIFIGEICKALINNDYDWVKNGLTSKSIADTSLHFRSFLSSQVDCYFENHKC